MESKIAKEAKIIWDLWAQMWNGDLEKADLIIAEGFYPNLLSDKYVNPKLVNNASKVSDWVALIRNQYQSLYYTTLAGPFTDENQKVLCCHWQAQGIFAGKTDLPSDIAGNLFIIEGTDILKFNNGKIYECWTQSNVVDKRFN